LVSDGAVGRVSLAGGGARDNNESLAIPNANLDDFSFGDSNHCRLCRAIVASEVVSQLQMHFLVACFILGRMQTREQDGECSGFPQGLYASVDYSSYDVSAVRYPVLYKPSPWLLLASLTLTAPLIMPRAQQATNISKLNRKQLENLFRTQETELHTTYEKLGESLCTSKRAPCLTGGFSALPQKAQALGKGN